MSSIPQQNTTHATNLSQTLPLNELLKFTYNLTLRSAPETGSLSGLLPSSTPSTDRKRQYAESMKG